MCKALLGKTKPRIKKKIHRFDLTKKFKKSELEYYKIKTHENYEKTLYLI